MSTLIVTAHPDAESANHTAATRLADLITDDEVMIAHLAQEEFNPRFTLADRNAYRSSGRPDPMPFANSSASTASPTSSWCFRFIGDRRLHS
jgi:putative NADPH-quinone reductase